MPRAKGGPKTRRRRKKRLKMAKGYWGGRHRLFRTATEAVDKAGVYAYRDRRRRKRDFRRLWITRISEAVKQKGLSYSSFIHLLKESKIDMDRKILSNLVTENPEVFETIVDKAKSIH